MDYYQNPVNEHLTKVMDIDEFECFANSSLLFPSIVSSSHIIMPDADDLIIVIRLFNVKVNDGEFEFKIKLLKDISFMKKGESMTIVQNAGSSNTFARFYQKTILRKLSSSMLRGSDSSLMLVFHIVK